MNAISKEIRNMHTVQQLIDKELLNIREVNGIMTLFISFRLHAAMIDDERKLSRWYMRFIMHIGLYTPYQRYKNMLRHILTYINCMRWANGQQSYTNHFNLLISNTMENDILLVGTYSPDSDTLHFDTYKSEK